MARNEVEKKMTRHMKSDQSSVICCDFGIARIFEQGEILAYPRTILRQFWSLSPFISELHFNFTREGGAVTQHSMYALASSMLAYPEQETHRVILPNQRAAEVFTENDRHRNSR